MRVFPLDMRKVTLYNVVMQNKQTSRREDVGASMDELSKAAKELDVIQHEAWQADLDLRKQAETDLALARIIADADAQYEATYGEPWRNPLADQS
jgi:hypothetical protein